MGMFWCSADGSAMLQEAVRAQAAAQKMLEHANDTTQMAAAFEVYFRS